MDNLVKMKVAFNNIFENKKTLITGNTGFKGSWLSIWLLKLGASVFGLSKNIPTKPSIFKDFGLKNKLNHFEMDIRDLDGLISMIIEIKPDFIFHLAAQPLVSMSYKNPSETISTNVIGTSNILEALRVSNHSCVLIVVTSDKCYDNLEWSKGYKETDMLGGKDIYSGSKGAAELVFKSYYHSFFSSSNSKVKCASVRAGNVIGGGDWAKDRIVPDCIRAWSKNEAVSLRNPDSTRPWQHVLEPLSGYLMLGHILFENSSLNGQSFNFGPPPNHNFSVKEILIGLSKEWGFKDVSKAYKIAVKSEFQEAGLLRLNCDKAFYHFGWRPTLNFEEITEFTGSWYYNFFNKKSAIYQYTLNQIEKFEHKAFSRSIKWIK
tara:strand:+ start:1092 stop:2219 length:1128 start_codon:yes stop_codon:yes gene_type:complete